jgi:hypothetical protein
MVQEHPVLGISPKKQYFKHIQIVMELAQLLLYSHCKLNGGLRNENQSYKDQALLFGHHGVHIFLAAVLLGG